MNTLLGRASWPLLGISDELLDQLRGMVARGLTSDELIDFLHEQKLPKAGATLALRLSGAIPIGETKLAVHRHPAYACRREADERFEESLVETLQEIERSEAA